MHESQKILVLGLAKSGTTALFSKIKASLGDEFECFFEPSIQSNNEVRQKQKKQIHNSKKVLVKDLLSVRKSIDYNEFDKKILIIRDPRDVFLSNLVYNLGNKNYYQDQPFKKRKNIISLLKSKREFPNIYSTTQLLEGLLEILFPDKTKKEKEFIKKKWFGVGETMELLCRELENSDFHIFRYEDMVDGNFKELEKYLGFSIAADQEVDLAQGRVVRTKSYGNWRHWFTSQDILELKPVFSPVLEKLGYSEDWKIHGKQEISISHCDGYVHRLWKNWTFRDDNVTKVNQVGVVKKSRFKTALVACVRNEGLYLLEWIFYHKRLGFDDIYIYSHDNSDGSDELLKVLDQKGIITHIDMSLELPRENVNIQLFVYKKAFERVKRDGHDWVLNIDLDEFLVLKKHKDINEFISSFPLPARGIVFNWNVFNSNKQLKRRNGFVTRRFTQKGDRSFFEVKTLARVKAVKNWGQIHFPNHHFQFGEGLFYPDKNPFDWKKHKDKPYYTEEVAVLNHYMVKSHEEFLYKIARGPAGEMREKIEEPGRGKKNLLHRVNKFNEGKDESILKTEAYKQLHVEVGDFIQKNKLLPLLTQIKHQTEKFTHEELGEIDHPVVKNLLPLVGHHSRRKSVSRNISTVLVTCIRNEGPYILEWVCYHKLLGFDEIYIYSHDNEDGSDNLLKQLDRIGLVHYRDMTGKIHERSRVQSFVYKEAFREVSKQQIDWMCVLDMDEFIVLKQHRKIGDFLSALPQDAWGVFLNWNNFNANNQFQKREGLVVERFTEKCHKCPKSVKTIAKLSKIDRWGNAHFPNVDFKIDGIVYYADQKLVPNGSLSKDPHHTEEVAVIHHYMTKSYEEILLKIARGNGYEKLKDIQKPSLDKSNLLLGCSRKTGDLDDSIFETEAYKKLNGYIEKIRKDHQLDPILNKIENKAIEFVRNKSEYFQSDKTKSLYQLMYPEKNKELKQKPNSEKPRTVLVACARNEGPYLLEWICYHKLLGFDEIHLYSHDNNDGSDVLLQKLDKAGLISYQDMTGKIPAEEPIQAYIYSQAFQRIKSTNLDWICVIDLDEFIVLKNKNTIHEFISSFPQNTRGICLNWQMFNSGQQVRKRPGLVVERFLTLGNRNRRSVKTIARVGAVKKWIGAHTPYPQFIGEGEVFYSDGTPVSKKPFFPDENFKKSPAVLNHYVLKSYEEFLIKIFRGSATRQYKDSESKTQDRTFLFDRHNQHQSQTDFSILKTHPYKKLGAFMDLIIRKNELKPILRNIEKKSQNFLEKKVDEFWSKKTGPACESIRKIVELVFPGKRKQAKKMEQGSKIIFIHTPKAAGSFVKRSLIANKKDFICREHLPPAKPLFEEQIVDNDSFIFTIIRNPWDRLVSGYFHLLNPQNQTIYTEKVKQYLSPFRNDFSAFVRALAIDPELQKIVHFLPQTHWQNGSHKRDLDFVVRYENLEEDLRVLGKCINCSFNTKKKINESSHKHYTKYYDEETKKIVSELYKTDIESFGYSFEGGPSGVSNNKLNYPRVTKKKEIIPEDNHKYVFVGGMHRSGTSIMHTILRDQKEISGFHKTRVPHDEGQHLIKDIIPNDEECGGMAGLGYSEKAHLTEDSKYATELNKRKILHIWNSHWNLKKKFLVEKTPALNLLRTRFWQKLFPNSYFLILTRHPIAYSYALLRMMHKEESIENVESLIQHWIACHEIYEQDIRGTKNLKHFRYEDFVNSPKKTLVEILEFLGHSKASVLKRTVKKNTNKKYFNAWKKAKKTNKKAIEAIEMRFEEVINKWGYSFDIENPYRSSKKGSIWGLSDFEKNSIKKIKSFFVQSKKPHKVVLLGIAKTGTTGLASRIQQNLPKSYKYFFEPYQLSERDNVFDEIEKEPRVLVKDIRADFKDLTTYDHFEKKILVVRDPRDRAISYLLYALGNLSLYKEDALHRCEQVIQLLQKKTDNPSGYPFIQLLDEILELCFPGDTKQNERKKINWLGIPTYRNLVKFINENPSYQVYKYESFVDGDFFDLEDYLEFPLTKKEKIKKDLKRVIRTKGHGNWKHWFTPEDVGFLRNRYQPFLDKLDYSSDWSISEKQEINSKHSEEYVLNLWTKWTFSQEPKVLTSLENLKSQKKEKTILVACARNEGPFLLEWICYHKLLGFDEIYIYSHDNEDGSDILLRKLHEIGLIQYVDMTGKIPKHKLIQCWLYSTAFQEIPKSGEDWMCVIDLDEFIVLREHKTIQEFIQSFPSDVDGIAFNWQIFNSNQKWEKSKGLVVDRFTQRGLRNPIAVKTMVKCLAIKNWFGAHYPLPKNPKKINIVYPDGHPCVWKKYRTEPHFTDKKAVVHHYLVKSYEEFLVKMGRGGGSDKGRNIFQPKDKKYGLIIRHNGYKGQTDTSIGNTAVYPRLKNYMNRIIEEHDLQDIVSDVEVRFRILSQRILAQTSKQKIQEAKEAFKKGEKQSKRPLKFIHITKTAGTSIKNQAEKHNILWGKNDPDLRKHKKSKSKTAFWHARPDEFEEKCLKYFDLFAVVRNPYERVISEFFSGVNKDSPKRTVGEFNLAIQRRIKSSRVGGGHWTPQSEYVFDNGQNRQIKHVIKYENLCSEFNNLMADYELPVRLDEKTVSNKSHPKTFGTSDFTSQTLSLINEYYDQDFKNFGYSKVLPGEKKNQKEPLYVFFHFPKTGGTTLKKNLKENLNPEEYCLLYTPNDSHIPSIKDIPQKLKTRNFKEILKELGGEDRAKIKVVFGHSVMFDYESLFPGRDIRFISMVRDPVEQALSRFNHFFYLELLKQPKDKNRIIQKFSDESYVYSFITESPIGGWKLIQQKHKDFYFIGITENSAEDFPKIFSMLGIQNVIYENENSKAKKFEELEVPYFSPSSNLRKKLQNHFKPEVELYENLKKKSVGSHGVENKIALIIPYFGRQFPSFFQQYLDSLSHSKKINLILFTDISLQPYKVPPNVTIVYNKYDEFCEKIRIKLQKYNIKFSPKRPYELCKIKPMLGTLFQEYILDYSHWAFGDIDVIYGNIDEVVNDLVNYDVLVHRGPFTVLRNNDYCNGLWKEIKDLRNLLASKKHYAVDETFFHPVIREKRKKGEISVKILRDYVADILSPQRLHTESKKVESAFVSIHKYLFIRQAQVSQAPKDQYFIVKPGEITGYINDHKDRNYSLLHLGARSSMIGVKTNQKCYGIIPNQIIDLEEISQKNIREKVYFALNNDEKLKSYIKVAIIILLESGKYHPIVLCSEANESFFQDLEKIYAETITDPKRIWETKKMIAEDNKILFDSIRKIKPHPLFKEKIKQGVKKLKHLIEIDQ